MLVHEIPVVWSILEYFQSNLYKLTWHTSLQDYTAIQQEVLIIGKYGGSNFFNGPNNELTHFHLTLPSSISGVYTESDLV